MAMRTLLLTVHISSGTLGLLAGPLAMLLPKRRGWHPWIGRFYQLCVALICLTAVGLAVMQPALWWLGVIATATWAAALAGWQLGRRRPPGWLLGRRRPPGWQLGRRRPPGWLLGRRRPPGWLPWHISLMCGSYISLVTALLVVNLGVHAIIAWALPTVVGSPLIARAAYRAATSPHVPHVLSESTPAPEPHSSTGRSAAAWSAAEQQRS
jgi:hypothetical protein